MSATWIEVRITLPDHRKAKAAARQLAIRRPWLVGHLVCLWAWAMENVPADGSLAGITDADLEDAAQWSEDRAGELVPAMVAAGFIDVDRTGRYLHDWEDYTGRLLRKREEDRARKAAERAAQRAAKTPTDAPKPVRKRRKGATPSEASPSDKPARPSDNKQSSSGQPANVLARGAPAPGRARAGGRADRTVPHRTGTELEEDLTARATSDDVVVAGDSLFGIESTDPRHQVAHLLKRRFRYRDVTDAQWERMAEIVDNEFPTGTKAGADRHAAWGWLAELMAGLDRKAGDPLEAAFAEVNRRIAERKQRADADEVDWSAVKEAAPVLAEAITAGSAPAIANGHGPRVSREKAIEDLRAVRGQVPEPAWSEMLARYHVTEEDLEDPVDFTPPEEAPAHG